VIDNSKPDLHIKLLAIAEEFQDTHFGSVTLRNVRIGPASWRMLEDEIKKTPPFLSWKLFANDNVEEERAFTVSGVSGADLAREVKEALSSKLSPSKEGTEGWSRTNSEVSLDKLVGGIGMTSNNSSTNSLVELWNAGIENTANIILSDDHLAATNAGNAVDDDKAEETNEYLNSQTISGVGGLQMQAELKRQIERENKLFLQTYLQDFY